MSELLDDAVQVLGSLPESMQETAARAIIDAATHFEDEACA